MGTVKACGFFVVQKTADCDRLSQKKLRDYDAAKLIAQFLSGINICGKS